MLAFLAALLMAACDRSEDDRASKAAEQKSETQAETGDPGQAEGDLAASFAGLFEPAPEEKNLLEAGPAVNPLGTVNGFFTNPQGVSGYFQNYEKPFNFTWSGKTETLKAFDGHVYQVMAGPGRMALKYMDEDKLLQRYDGETAQGLLNGFGEQWSRNNLSEGHHYFVYRGDLRHDQMEGQGIMSDYDFSAQEVPPVRYEGGLRNSLFHGQGRIFDLSTGETMQEGLWLANEPFEGSEEEWRQAVKDYDLESADRQYRDVLMTDDLVLDGLLDEGAEELVVIAPQDAENVTAVDQTGHKYVFASGSYLEDLGYSGEWATALGSREKRPLSDYPLTIDLSYSRNGKKHVLRFTALRPFGLVVQASGPGLWTDEKPEPPAGIEDGPQVTLD